MAKRDPLDNIAHNNEFKAQARSIKTPYHKDIEPTKTVQIRQHIYRELKILSVLRKESMVDIACNVLGKYLKKQPELKGIIGQYINKETK